MDKNSEIDQFLNLLKEVQSIYPDMRFGQLVCNLSYWAKGANKSAPWDVENIELINIAKEHIAKNV